jgi:hypothetical protein
MSRGKKWGDVIAVLRTIREDQYPSEAQMHAIDAVVRVLDAPKVACVGCGAPADPRLTDTAAFCEACYRREHYLAKLEELGATIPLDDADYVHPGSGRLLKATPIAKQSDDQQRTRTP